MSRTEGRPQSFLGPSVELRAYIATLRSRKWSIIWVVLLTVSAALAFTLRQTPIYQARTEVLVKPPALEPGQPGAGAPPDMATERRLAASAAVAEFAARRLKSGASLGELQQGLSVESDAESEILSFAYSHRDPESARALSQAFADAYLEFRSQDLRSDLVAAFEAQRDRLRGMENRMRQLNAEYEATQDPNKRATLQAEGNELHGQIGYLRNQLAQSTPPEDIRVGRVVDPADVPSSPSSPNHVLNGGVGLFAGLALGIALAFLRERLDDRLRGQEDLEAILGTSVLAVVPRVREWKRAERTLLVARSDPQSPAAEAYRSLRTSLLFTTSAHDMKTVLITSAHPDEGKSSTTANLGFVLAQAGRRVTLVSADLRKPRLHNFFGVQDAPGLTNVLAGETSLSEALTPLEPENLRLIQSGAVPANPGDLLGSPAMQRVLKELREDADLVLIDAAPILAVADPIALAPSVDGVVFIADATTATQSGVDQARQRLKQVNARIIGAVLNNYDPAKPGSYGHYYGRDYGQRHTAEAEDMALPRSQGR